MRRLMNAAALMTMASVLAFAGCSSDGSSSMSHSHATRSEDGGMQEGKPTVAVAVMNPTEGNKVRGTVTFVEVGDGVRVVAELTGLTPGRHGFHIHEKGDCSAPDGTSAGGHFSPEGNPHGGPGMGEHHTGDMGNITADDDGRAYLNEVYPFMTFKGEHSILGKGVIVHADADDLKSQPTGAAGARQACGVIEKTDKVVW